MGLADKLNEILKEAMKEKDEIKISSIRAIKSAMNYKKAEAGKDPDENEILELIAKEAKKRKDSITQFRAGGREDLATKEEAELEIISKFLPEQASDADIEERAKIIIAETGATSMKEMGKVMGKLMGEFKGRADGNQVKAVLQKLLS